MDLFDQHLMRITETEAPLAARMRPRSLDEFIGQDHIIGQGRLLRRAISLDQLSSLIFAGPPGTGKTTLARVIANTTRADFIAINAVLSGVKEIRVAIETAQAQRKYHNQKTILCTLSQIGTQLATVRERIFTITQLQRHHVVLDINAGTGLLTWEALRHVPEGGVYTCVRHDSDAQALREQATTLDELRRPIVLTAQIIELPAVLACQGLGVNFDYIIGRNALLNEPDKNAAAQILAQILPHSGRIVLAETVPRHTQRLYRLLDEQKLGVKLYARLVAVEEAIYTNVLDPMLSWDVEDLRKAFEVAGLTVEVVLEKNSTTMHITSAFLNRLFTSNIKQPSYLDRLAVTLNTEELKAIKEIFTQYLLNQTVNWESRIAFVQT